MQASKLSVTWLNTSHACGCVFPALSPPEDHINPGKHTHSNFGGVISVAAVGCLADKFRSFDTLVAPGRFDRAKTRGDYDHVVSLC